MSLDTRGVQIANGSKNLDDEQFMVAMETMLLFNLVLGDNTMMVEMV